MREYKGIEIGRIVFACLIPLLHIPFAHSMAIEIIRQYISRLGVPFFFAVSGMFLSNSIRKRQIRDAMKKYFFHIGRLLLIWGCIYLPLIIRNADSSTNFFQELAFKTPAYLWYLTALLVALVPFCLIKNRKLLLCIAAVLYFLGTLYGGSYKWLTGGLYWYDSIFLTTRNGVFFGLPLMCVGELVWERKRHPISLAIITGILLFTEITFVGKHTDKMVDRSMYFFLPVFIFAILLLLKEWNPNINVNYFGKISSAIYLMQYGIISLSLASASMFQLVINNVLLWVVYIVTITIPFGIYYCIRNTKIVNVLF